MPATLALLLGGALFHLAYVVVGPLSLSPDEAHYWEWSRRLDWSYYSKGPAVAWIIAASTALLGATELGVRAPAVLLALGTGLVGMRLSLDLFASRRAAFLAAALGASLPLYSAGSMLMTIDAPFLFFWSIAAWSTWRALRGPGAWWVVCGVAIGLGTLGKYTMALFVPCAIGAVALGSRDRRAAAAGLACALAIAIPFAAPIVYWNAQHDWVSLRHVLAQTGLAGGGEAFSGSAPSPTSSARRSASSRPASSRRWP